jgi:hypothetical protein
MLAGRCNGDRKRVMRKWVLLIALTFVLPVVDRVVDCIGGVE